MESELRKFQEFALQAISSAQSSADLEHVRVQYLGRKGQMSELMKGLKDVTSEQRKVIGQVANEVKKKVEAAFSEREKTLEVGERKAREDEEWIDISAPGTASEQGHLHLVTQAIEEIAEIFSQIGFVQVRHPEIDWDWYSFESLNMPKTHPARDEWETFFIADGDKVQTGEKGKVVLTPHSSNGQVREMERGRMPIRAININKCYRRQSTVRHSPMFHQFEGWLIGENVNITHMKGVFDYFVKQFFGPDRETRLRPYHFRFTEPSFEIDISAEKGKEDSKLYKDGWLELGGAGMMHPNVLRAGGLDPEKYTGIAFGWGLERTMMMKSGMNIDDIRLLYKNDMRFLEQF
jgi:phenylalanyl-tRNA synthetase alpha chain